MLNTARRIEDSTAWQGTGTVTLIDDGVFVVDTGDETLRAKRAVGCLVQPEFDDLVLVAVAREGAWVLSVLEREEGATSRVVVDGDLELKLPKGRVTVAAQGGVDVASGAPMRVVTPSFEVNAGEGSVAAQALTVFGAAVSMEAETVKLVAGAVDQAFDRLTQRAKRVYRFVEDFEQLRAGRLDYVAKRLLELHGATAAVTAETLVKVDAEQIHVG